jgi:hypothetical protein
MFSARQHESDDQLRELLFSKTVTFVESKAYANTDWHSIKNGFSHKAFLRDAYTYITRDRLIKMNEIIEQEILQDEEPEWSNIENEDTYYMQGLFDCRKLLF